MSSSTKRKIEVVDEDGRLNVKIETDDRSLARWILERTLDDDVSGAQFVTIDHLINIASSVSAGNKLKFMSHVRDDFNVDLEAAKHVAKKVWDVRKDKTDQHLKALQTARAELLDATHDYVTPDTPPCIIKLLKRLSEILGEQDLQ